jgi:hypothetical protein
MIGQGGDYATVHKAMLLPQSILHHKRGFTAAVADVFQANGEVAHEIGEIKNPADIL